MYLDIWNKSVYPEICWKLYKYCNSRRIQHIMFQNVMQKFPRELLIIAKKTIIPGIKDFSFLVIKRKQKQLEIWFVYRKNALLNSL